MKLETLAKGSSRAIRVRRRFDAPLQSVFSAWLDPELASKWLFATALHPIASAEIDARIGGSFRFVDRRDGSAIDYSGNYLEIVPSRRLVFSLSMDGVPQAVTRVSVEFVLLATGCEVILTHENVPPDDADHVEARWTGILYGLDETLASNITTLSPSVPPLLEQGGETQFVTNYQADEIPVPDLR